MKRIIVSDEDLPTRLPQILHINREEHPQFKVSDLMSLLHKHFPALASTLAGVRTFTQDYFIDYKLLNPNFVICSLKLPIELIVILKDDHHLISSNTNLTLSHFSLLKQIGHGMFSRVYLCSTRYNRHLYTMKVVNKASLLENGEISQLLNEIEIFKSLRNIPWIPNIYYCFEDRINVYLVLEYCPNSDLFSQLNKQKRFSEEDAKIVFVQALWCLTILRERGVIHRDVKPENFIVDSEGCLKITDFGFAKKINPGEKVKGLCGSYQYMAPEMILNRECSFSYDIYGLGILLYQLLVGNTPFQGVGKENIKEVIQSQIQFPKDLNPQVTDLINKLTTKSPEERLGASNIKDIFSHPWLQSSIPLIKQIISRKRPSPFYELPSLKDLKTLPSISPQQKLWGISYNYLTPTFDIEFTKLGPKLSTQTLKETQNGK